MDLIRLDSVIEVKRVLAILYAAGGFLFLYGLQSYVNRHKAELKKFKVQAEKEKRRLESELKEKQVIEEKLRNEVESVGQELASLALKVIQKSELLEEVKGQLKEIKTTCSENSVGPKVNKMLVNINFSQDLEKDWNKFKVYFDQVHQGFFDNLLASYPALNANDLKLCAMLKLNLDTKQIAGIMDISPESAKVARYRLRKKLNVPSEQKLILFLNQYDPTFNPASKYSL